jgi:hypothetical protein
MRQAGEKPPASRRFWGFVRLGGFFAASACHGRKAPSRFLCGTIAIVSIGLGRDDCVDGPEQQDAPIDGVHCLQEAGNEADEAAVVVARFRIAGERSRNPYQKDIVCLPDAHALLTAEWSLRVARVFRHASEARRTSAPPSHPRTLS